MTALPVISGKKCIQILQGIGFYIKRRESSHIIIRRDVPFAQITVPDHRTIDRGTLRTIIRQSGLEVDEFVKLLK